MFYEYLWDQEDARIPPYESGSIWLWAELAPPAPGFVKTGRTHVMWNWQLVEWSKPCNQLHEVGDRSSAAFDAV